MQMPGMDGTRLAREIKADPLISSTRLLLLTSLGRRGDSAEARQAGIEAYLTKPVRQSQLYDALATVMSTPEASPKEDPRLVTRHTLRERRASAQARLLVAEDNEVNQKVAVMMLERLGYRADVAANGIEAVEALSRIPYAAVLMDVQMPKMDGYEATAKVRELEGTTRHTPIIAMTANALAGDREKALAAGMDDYIAKPVKPEALGAVLRRWVPQEESPAPEVPEKTGAGEALDPEVMAGLRELGGAEMLTELAGMFLDDASSCLATLREAIEAGDANSAERVAHTLKGSSGNMGAKEMAAICAELQDTGSSGDLTRAPELLEQLEDEFKQVRSALEAEIAGDGD
jgi:CheY-like chemotaxis protein/HPt (histidine-containing phosphotransfer) domain-containing protein